jgi:hypothetical protein
MFDVADLAGFPGEFSPEMVDAAVASIRADAGWHIAPVVTETITVFGDGGRVLFLPSLRVISVASVKVLGVVPLSNWQLGNGGTLYAPYGWAYGPLQVTFTHGYETAPDLIPEVVARISSYSRDPSVTSTTRTSGPFSDTDTYRNGGADEAFPSSVSRYRIPVVG